MTFLRRILWLIFAGLLTAGNGRAATDGYGEMASVVTQAMEQNHYSHHAMDAAFSRQLALNYMEELDPDHLYFNREEIGRVMEEEGPRLGPEMRAGGLDAAMEIFALYRKEVEQRAKKAGELLKTGTFTFDSNRSVETDRSHSAWPAEAAADGLWRDRLEGELLDEKLDGASMGSALETVSQRYAQAEIEVRNETRLDAVDTLLAALAHSYDPHSDFLTDEDMDEMNSDMRLSMVGIGVVLESDGRYVRVTDVIPGSPAAQAAIKARDRIVAVGQESGPFTEVAGIPFKRVLEMIHGKSGTHLRLQMAAPGEAVGRRTVELVRRKIELADDEASAETIEHLEPDGQRDLMGWITLPSFYGDPGATETRSSAHDMRLLLKRLNEEKIRGLVIDLRGNPGGELEEAVNIGGLFMGKVPIVQERDTTGARFITKAEGGRLYGGPLVILTDHLTASAAELFASAMQDYGRALIVGGLSHTYGKGSVQTIVDLDELLPRRKHEKERPSGALQLTIAKFYRVSGHSVQLRGLAPDIELPSPEDLPDEGEGKMKNALEYDELAPVAKINPEPLPLLPLRDRSAARVAANPEFRYVREDVERTRKELESNRVSLNEGVRRAELAEEKAREEQRKAERAQRKSTEEKGEKITLAQIESGKKKSAGKEAERATVDAAASAPDPMRDETLNILGDLVRQRVEAVARVHAP